MPKYFAVGLPSLLFVFLVLQCAPLDPKLLPPAETLAAASGVDQDDLAEGRSYYLRDCAGCHVHIWPREKQPKQWKLTLKEHRARVPLTRAQYEKLKLYVLTASKTAWELVPKRP